MGGATELTVKVNGWVAFGEMPFAAVMVSGNVPEAVGVPLRVAVPFPLSTKETPLGRLPVSVMAGIGLPVVFTVNAANVPSVKLAVLALVIVGAEVA